MTSDDGAVGSLRGRRGRGGWRAARGRERAGHEQSRAEEEEEEEEEDEGGGDERSAVAHCEHFEQNPKQSFQLMSVQKRRQRCR